MCVLFMFDHIFLRDQFLDMVLEKAQESLRNMNLTKDEPADYSIPVVEAEFVDVVQQVTEERE